MNRRTVDLSLLKALGTVTLPPLNTLRPQHVRMNLLPIGMLHYLLLEDTMLLLLVPHPVIARTDLGNALA